MKRSRIYGFLLAIFTTTLITACGGSDSSSKGKTEVQKNPVSKEARVTVAVVTNNPEQFWNICEAGANKAAKEHNVELIFRRPSPGTVAAQMDIVNALVKQEISGLALSVLDPVEQTPDLKRIAGKLNFITMDNDAEKSNRLCYVGTENYSAGRAVGKMVKEVMPEGGTIAIFVGNIASLNSQQRYQGVVDELADQKDAKGPQFGKYTLYRNEPITDDGNRELAQTNAKTVVEQLAGKKDVCLIGLYAYNPPAILEALRSKGLVGKMQIVGFDEDTATLSAIEKGEVYGTVVQDPFNFGYKSVEILAAEARGDKSKRLEAAVPHRIVTKDGIDPKTKKKDRLVATEFAVELNKLLSGK
jgi:ribose transport system substrate-binding protein